MIFVLPLPPSLPLLHLSLLAQFPAQEPAKKDDAPKMLATTDADAALAAAKKASEEAFDAYQSEKKHADHVEDALTKDIPGVPVGFAETPMPPFRAQPRFQPIV